MAVQMMETLDRTRYESYSEQLIGECASLDARVEAGSLAIRTHSVARIDIEARLRNVELRVWQKDGRVFLRAENSEPQVAGHPIRREAQILVTVPSFCETFVQMVAGNLNVSDVTAAVRTHVITGKTTLNNLQDRVFATSLTGSIHYDGLLVDGVHRFMTTTGSLRLSLQQLPNARIYARTTIGKVHCGLPLSGQRRGGRLLGDQLYGVAGSGLGRVQAEVVTGSVHIGSISTTA